MPTFNLENHLKGIAYHSDEATSALREVGEIAEWEFRPLNDGENVQSDVEAEHGPSAFHFAISVTTSIRDWAGLTLKHLQEAENSESLLKRETLQQKAPESSWLASIGKRLLSVIGKSDDESDYEDDHEDETDDFSESASRLLDAIELLRSQFGEKHLRERLEEILEYIDGCDFPPTRTSEKGNKPFAVLETIRTNLRGISAEILNKELVEELEAALEGKGEIETEQAGSIEEKVKKTDFQLKLLTFQETILAAKATLYDGLADFGRFSPDRGIFDEIIDDLLSDTEIPEKPPTMVEFIEQLPKLGVTIVNPDEIHHLYISFRVLVKAHYHKIAFLTGVTPDRVDVGMIL